MLISVIITTYNSPDFLKKCLNSFLKQKDKNFEIVIADDGSTEDTKRIIENFDVINLPSITIPQAGSGTTALIQPVVKGELKEVLVDQQGFDIEDEDTYPPHFQHGYWEHDNFDKLNAD